VRFWQSFGKFPSQQRQKAQKTFLIFKGDPFDPRLRSHKIYRLTARYGRTVYAAEIEPNLRAVFYVEGDVVVTWTSARTRFMGGKPDGIGHGIEIKAN
jgi:hypothetical protein